VKIIVKGYFNLQKAMEGKSLVEVEKETASIREVLQDLSDRFGKDLTELIHHPEDEEPAGRLIVLVNGRNHLSMPDKLDTPLKDGDEIALFPPLAGG
jgi:molybdopterin synthase sulfur carrier subunit